MAPALAELMEGARALAARRPPGCPPALVQIVAGDDAWLVDTRAGTPAHRSIRHERQLELADVVVTLDEETLSGLVDGTLPPFRAWSERRLSVKGDHSKLRALEWLIRATRGEPAKSTRAVASVYVRSANGDKGHGSYEVLVSESAMSWTVWRRWSELKRLAAELEAEYGAATPYRQALPTLKAHSLRSSTSAGLLRDRQRQMHEYLSSVLELLPTSPRTGVGPHPLLRFLGADSFEAANSPSAVREASTESFCDTLPVSPPAPFASALATAVPGGSDWSHQPMAALRVGVRLDTLFGEISVLRMRLQLAQLCAILAVTLAVLAYVHGEGATVSTEAAMAESSWLMRGAILAVGGWRALAVAGALLVAALLPRWRAKSSSLFRRGVRVSVIFVQILTTYKLARMRVRRLERKLEAAAGEGELEAEIEAVWERAHDRAGAALHSGMVALGGLWVKLGQVLASRSDAVPTPIVKRLSSMLDSNPPRPLSEVVRTVEAELGAAAARIASIDPSPLSTASIAQVHTARLVDGTKVVLKVQHMEVGAMVRQDLAQSLVLGRVLAFLEPDFDFRSILDEASNEHAKELDFRIEAANLVDVRSNLARARVVAEIPTPVDGLVSERALVMTFCEGIRLTSGEDLREAGIDVELLVGRICEAWAAQLFTDGVFNCDPHAGNLLCRLDPLYGPLPVLLDFGLCKRLSAESRLNFCQLVYSMGEQDCDALVQSLRALGLRINVEAEPFEMLADLMFHFRNSDGDAESSRRRVNAKIKRDMEVAAVYREVKHRRRKVGKKRPLEAIPPEIIYFMRTISMLQGLCTRLGVSYPFLRPMEAAARQALLRHSREQLGVSPLSVSRPLAPGRRGRERPLDAPLRVAQLLSALTSVGEVLGAQASLFVRGRCVVDVAAGTLGPADARPVRSDTLFQLFQAGSPLLAALLLQRLARGQLALSMPIAKAWPAFARRGLTIGALLSHCTGLASVMPQAARLRELLQPVPMSEWLASAADAQGAGDGATAEYEGAAWGWAVAGLLRAIDGGPADWSVQQVIERDVTGPIGLADELRLSLTEEMCQECAARHSMSAMMRELGIEMSDLFKPPSAKPPSSTTSSPNKPATTSPLKSFTPSTESTSPVKAGGSRPLGTQSDDEEEEMFAKSNEGMQWGRFQGVQQLQSPQTLNAKQARCAEIPGISAHGSARALARFYAALTDSIHGADVLQLGFRGLLQSRSYASTGSMNGMQATWALGLQLGEVVDASGRTYMLLGHMGLGGTVGLCVPECGVSLAVTVSQLSVKCGATRRLVELLLHEAGLRLKPGFLPG